MSALQDEPALQAALERSTRTGMHVVALRAATYATSFAVSIVVARALGPDGRGRYALPMVVLAVALALANLGIEHAQIFLAGRGVPLATLWANSTLVGLVAGVGTWLVGLILLLTSVGRVGTSVETAWLVVVIVQVPLLLHVLYWLNLLQLAGRVRAGVATGLVVAGAQLAAVVALVALDVLTPFVMLLVIGAMNVLTWALVLTLGARSGLVAWAVDRDVLREGLRFGIRAQLGIVFVFLLLRVDQLMVERALGFEALGIYVLAVTLAEFLWLLSEPFASSLLPHQVAAGDGDDVKLGFAVARMSVALVGVVAVAAWIVAPLVIRWCYGPAFVEAAAPFRWLLPGVVALAIQRPLAGVLLKRGRVGLVSGFGAIALVANVGLNLALLPALGSIGASVASSVAYLVLATAYVVAIKRQTPVALSHLMPRTADVAVIGRAVRGAVGR